MTEEGNTGASADDRTVDETEIGSRNVDGTSGESKSGEGTVGNESTPGTKPVLPVDERFQLTVPEGASPEEAAAIVAAIGVHVSDLESLARADSPEETWNGRRWSFAGRLESISGGSVRVPSNAPIDPWTASARVDRF